MLWVPDRLGWSGENCEGEERSIDRLALGGGGAETRGPTGAGWAWPGRACSGRCWPGVLAAAADDTGGNSSRDGTAPTEALDASAAAALATAASSWTPAGASSTSPSSSGHSSIDFSSVSRALSDRSRK